ncbi:hypothetical protein VKI22_02995 [Cyanobacterium aponinum UTEX 3221]|uniref:hypothetical protein n=1 Tax=Cyanobacterium aponinum TaxID=379064 RepID=UPI002B4C05B1|nr:hypothetical protein [Cyanobacterium aponinum]WRL39080.1 hypothetical protein VKI22_02995 [Cyanobacterium aponinum UTEX 3221]
MISLKQISHFLITTGLVLFIAITNVFGVIGEKSYASISEASSMSLPNVQIAWGWGERAKAVTKNIEGKT